MKEHSQEMTVSHVIEETGNHFHIVMIIIAAVLLLTQAHL